MGIYFRLLLVVFFWGSANVAVKAVLPELDPAVLVYWRHLGATAVLIAAVLATKKFTMPKLREWPGIFLLGFFGVFLYQILQTTGLVHTTATNSGWLGLLAPVFIALLSFAFLGEKASWLKVIGIGLAFGGALGITLGDLTGWQWTAGNVVGDLLILAAAVSWAVFSVLARGLAVTKTKIPLIITTYSFIAGVVMLTPLVPWPEGLQLHMTFRGILIMAYLTVGCSAAAYLLWYHILDRMEASRAGVWLYLTPLVTSATAVLIGEKISVTCLGFGLMTLAGVLLAGRNKG